MRVRTGSWGHGATSLAGRGIIGAVLGLVLSWTALLRAEDVPPDPLLAKVAALEKLVADHAKQAATAALLEDAKQALALHKEVIEKPPLKKRTLDVFRSLLRAVKEDSDKRSVLEALGGTADPEAAVIVRPFLRQPNVKEADALLLTAIETAGKLPSKDTVQTLLALVEKSKHMGAALAAMNALGSFGTVKPQRERVLETLIDIVEPLQPGGRPGPRGGGGGVGDSSDPPPSGPANAGEAAERWAALAPVLPKVLNSLTKRTIGSAEQWFLLAKQHKRDLGRLFNDE